MVRPAPRGFTRSWHESRRDFTPAADPDCMTSTSLTDERSREVRRLPRDSAPRRLFFLAVLTLAASLSAWILWLLESVE
mgnify:CR=1 FL=1